MAQRLAIYAAEPSACVAKTSRSAGCRHFRECRPMQKLFFGAGHRPQTALSCKAEVLVNAEPFRPGQVLPRSDAADRTQAHPRMDFVLRHHECLRTKALDDRADIGPHARTCQEDRYVACASGLLEAVPHGRNEFLQHGRLHRELFLLSLADQGFGESLFPARRQRDERDGILRIPCERRRSGAQALRERAR